MSDQTPDPDPKRDAGDVAEPAAEAGAADPESDADAAADAELSGKLLAEVERLTRLARRAVDENERTAYRERREDLLDPHDFTARVREADDTLVVHPAEWLEEGTVRTDRIDDTDRAVEIPLSGPGDPDDWAAMDTENRELVAAVEDAHGPVHGANAAALADFMGNHYAKPITAATREELEEFRTEYFVRNAWPSDDQRDAVEESIELLFEVAETSPPV